MLNVNRMAAWAALTIVTVGGNAWADDTKQPAAGKPQWIGVMCVPIDDALRAQLQLDEGEGLLVRDVVADGPAAKAGVQQYDVLLSAADKPLTDVPTLSAVVEQGKPFTLELLRGGKKTTLNVTPADRPRNQPGPAVLPRDREELQDWFKQFRPGDARILDRNGDPRRLRFRFFHPGQVFDRAERKDWPRDLRISITREGDKPLRITVERGDEKWEVSRDELGKLPEQIRPFVERMLAGNGPAVNLGDDFEVELPQVDLPELPKLDEPALPKLPDVEKDVQRKLDEINRQLQQLQRQLREQRQEKSGGEKGA